MKEKTKFSIYIIVVVALFHFLLVVGCGKNPILSSIVGSGTVEIIKY